VSNGDPPSPPTVSLNAVSSVGPGSSVDMTGASALAATASCVVTVTGFATSPNADKTSLAADLSATVQLQASQDGSNFVTLGGVEVNANGTFRIGPAAFPSRFLRASLTRIGAAVSSLTVTAYVAAAA
jgi:hypothetical protein